MLNVVLLRICTRLLKYIICAISFSHSLTHSFAGPFQCTTIGAAVVVVVFFVSILFFVFGLLHCKEFAHKVKSICVGTISLSLSLPLDYFGKEIHSVRRAWTNSDQTRFSMCHCTYICIFFDDVHICVFIVVSCDVVYQSSALSLSCMYRVCITRACTLTHTHSATFTCTCSYQNNAKVPNMRRCLNVVASTATFFSLSYTPCTIIHPYVCPSRSLSARPCVRASVCVIHLLLFSFSQ